MGQHPQDDFTTALKGGRWTQAVLNVPYHLCEARARSPVAIEWVQTAGMNRVASFSFSKYGEEASSLLAMTWCARMTWLIETFPELSEVAPAQREVMLRSYAEPSSAARIRSCFPKKQHVMKRLEEILRLEPSPKQTGRASASSRAAASSAPKTCGNIECDL
eukprot:6490623-Amphidinium_carterae.3